MKVIKPFLKWVGGKTQVIDKLMNEFPAEINNYYEPFLGGGSVLFALLTYAKHGLIRIDGKIFAYDINEPLVYVYRNIQSCPYEVYNTIQIIISEYETASGEDVNRKPANIEEAMKSKENYYYWIRQRYNGLCREDKRTPLGSAMFIFLNKTCFRGIFRVGPNGFNVPYGNYKNPEIINREHLEEIHLLIQDVAFQCCGFADSLKLVDLNDFAYLDPPYAPETETSFVGYTENGFNYENHLQLFQGIHAATEKGAQLMMSNSAVALVRENFSDREKYKVIDIVCKRSIHSKKPETKANEVIIKNW